MKGMFDGLLARIEKEYNEIHEAQCTGEYTLQGSFVQLEVEHDGQNIWVDVVSSSGGSGSTVLSTPIKDQKCLIAMPRNNPNNGYFMGYVSVPSSGSEAPEASRVSGQGYFILTDADPIIIQSQGGKVTMENGSGSVVIDGDTITTKSGQSTLEVSPGAIEGKVGQSTISLKSSGACKMSNTQGAFVECKATGFVDMGNATGTVLGLIRTLALGCQTGTVPTIIGPQLMISPNFAQVLAKVTTIKGA